MKTLFTFALAGLLATSSFASSINEDLVSLSKVEAKFKKINVHLKEGVGHAKISIIDESGKKLHQRRVNVKEDLRIPYNMDMVPSGEFTVEISTDDEKISYTVITSDEAQPEMVYPLMAYGKQVGDNVVDLLVIGLEEPGVNVQIKTERGNKLIHEEYIKEPNGFRKDFRFNNVDPEDVYFVVTDAKGRTRTLHF